MKTPESIESCSKKEPAAKTLEPSTKTNLLEMDDTQLKQAISFALKGAGYPETIKMDDAHFREAITYSLKGTGYPQTQPKIG